ncbi:DUF3141 domain-containing protein [Rhodovulum steppense]|uniref:Uncharacterized protein DUF3141 n=1 Tax=Rhodovulum steppense TaxID=540251 RepID=A0A4R1YG48_9RHOB|nr:DUF3141 domain-containing protein [Rhodovulum steppense]TCM75070.1 uncharacterized protein DUF3141 [Rhodovulum steppense]
MTERGLFPFDPFGLVRRVWRVNEIALGHGRAIALDQSERWHGVFTQTATVMRAARMSGRHATAADWAEHWREYLRDSAERTVLAADILRQRGDALATAEEEGAPPALPHAQEPVREVKGLARPCNARLVRLVSAAAPDPAARPVLLVTPRAGGAEGLARAAGAGLAAGLPVYAAGFVRLPVPGQTMADVVDALGAFVAEIARRHPGAPAPLVLGQGPGGWLPLVLAAAHPGSAGAVLLDAVPLAPGMPDLGGALAGMLSDLGGGLFDGATHALVTALDDPHGRWLRPLAGILAEADRAGPRVVEAARRGGGPALLTREEACWAAHALPPGDRLARNATVLAEGRPLDLRSIAAPVLICLRPDDPAAKPAEVLGWLARIYPDANAIRAAGQRVVVLRHAEAGPGLVLAGRVDGLPALEAVAALTPGLYLMDVEAVEGRGASHRFALSLAPCAFEALDEVAPDADAATHAAAARAQRMQAEIYEALAPALRATIAPPVAAAARALHPLRLGQAVLSSRNPWLSPVAPAAARVRETRKPAAPDNPFVWVERMGFELAGQWLDLGAAMRRAGVETGFHAVWGNPWMRAFGAIARPATALEAVPEPLGRESRPIVRNPSIRTRKAATE